MNEAGESGEAEQRSGRHVHVVPDRQALTAQALELVVDAARDAIATRGRFRILLAGGSTPCSLYAALAADERPQWEAWELFWGDERAVPPDDVESNYAMVRDALLDPLVARGRGPGRVARFQTELAPVDAAAHYDTLLRALAEADGSVPRFDVALLGMGADGHTASLFPHTAALHEAERLAVANPVPQLGVTRLTVTYALLNAARQVIVLVAGADKAPALAAVLDGSPDPERLPSQAVAPKGGSLIWLVDAAAAARPSAV